MIYELKTYIPNTGKETAMRNRFMEHTLPLFEKSGISVVAVFEPVTPPAQLVYITRFADDETRVAAWAKFQADPEWKEIKAESEVDGPLMASQSTSILRSLDDALVI